MGKQHARRMVASMLVALCVGFAGIPVVSSNPVVSETSKDVGFGFRVVYRSQKLPPGAMEEVGHFAFLFYKDRELGPSHTYSISPSGRYALFQDGPTGDVELFVPGTGQQRIVLKYPGTLVNQFVWREDRLEATVIVANRPPLQVSLSAH